MNAPHTTLAAGKVDARIASGMAQKLELRNVSKSYGDIVAVDQASLTVLPGEFMTLLGPSGSGKTTMLMLIAGFEPLTAGEIRIGDKRIDHIPSYRRNIGVVFQQYALFPHMTVYENLAFPLKVRGYDRGSMESSIERALDRVRLVGYSERYPQELSGGQQQRVAVARATVFDPSLLLMDEPLSALDKKLREQMQLELKHLQRQLGITVISVTHDQTEALLMSDRVALMDSGRIVQVGTPDEIYERPANRFVADFIGESNLLELRAVRNGETIEGVSASGLRVILPSTVQYDATLTVVLRPERIQLFAADDTTPHGLQQIAAVVEEVIYIGDGCKYRLRTAGETLVSKQQLGTHSRRFARGDSVRLCWYVEDMRILASCDDNGRTA